MAQGEVRQSQLITTYGPGAMVDLPDHSVVIGGLNLWNYGPNRSVEIIDEPRLLAKLRQSLRINNLQLQKPPINETGPGGLKKGPAAVGIHFHLILSKSDLTVPSYDQKTNKFTIKKATTT